MLALAAACAFGDPSAVLPRYTPGKPASDALAENDAKKWGSYQLGGDWLKLRGDMQSRVGELDAALKDFAELGAAEHPGMDAVFQRLYSAAGKSLRVRELPGRQANAAADEFVERGHRAVEGYHDFAGALDKKTRLLLYDTMDLMAGRKFPATFNSWKKAVGTLEHLVFTTEFKAFDAVFGEWMQDVETLRRNKVVDVAGTELMLKTRLDRYANDDCRVKGFLDGDARVVDKMLVVLREEERARLADTTALLRDRAAKLRAALQEVRAQWEGGFAADVLAQDRRDFDGLFVSFSQFCNALDKTVEKTYKMLETVQDKSTETGRLRYNTGFSPNKAFECAGPTQANGCPYYARRVSVAIEDCKSAYMKVMRELKGADAKWE